MPGSKKRLPAPESGEMIHLGMYDAAAAIMATNLKPRFVIMV
jgi:hypothetical protein